MKKINEDLFLFVNHDFYGSGGYYIWYATAMLFWTSASCFGLFSITFIINTMTKVMLNLENSFFKFLQEILARSFINAVFAFCSRHLKVWRVTVPFMWNTMESSWACRNTSTWYLWQMWPSPTEIFWPESGAWTLCTEKSEFTAEKGTKRGTAAESQLVKGW